MKHKSYIISAVFLFFCAIVIFYLYNTNNIARQEEETVMCTMDALICPDGSGVGRSGKDCVFSPCPNGNLFIGEFQQDSNGFRLIMESPKGIGNETSYVMPLQVTVTNVLKEFIGKKVQVRGSFVTGNTLHVDSMEEANDSILETGTVPMGKTVYINRVFVTLHSVVQDSRCPIDAQCIEAGAITARVTLKSDTDTETFNMPSDEAPRMFDSYKVSIIDIQPPRMSGKETNQNDYVLTFKVTSL